MLLDLPVRAMHEKLAASPLRKIPSVADGGGLGFEGLRSPARAGTPHAPASVRIADDMLAAIGHGGARFQGSRRWWLQSRSDTSRCGIDWGSGREAALAPVPTAPCAMSWSRGLPVPPAPQ